MNKIGPPYPLPLPGRYATLAFENLPEEVQQNVKDAWAARGIDQGEIDRCAQEGTGLRSTVRSDAIDAVLAGQTVDLRAQRDETEVDRAEIAQTAYGNVPQVPVSPVVGEQQAPQAPPQVQPAQVVQQQPAQQQVPQQQQ